jgi:thioesterase-3
VLFCTFVFVNGIDRMVRGFHCDAYGHVNNARYLELLEDARWEFLQPAVEEQFFDKRNLIFVVVNINISYKKPVVPNTLIHIEITNAQFNNKSVVVEQQVLKKDTGEVCTDAAVTFVLLDKDTWKPATITPEIIAKFEFLAAQKNG